MHVLTTYMYIISFQYPLKLREKRRRNYSILSSYTQYSIGYHYFQLFMHRLMVFFLNNNNVQLEIWL